MKTKSKTKSEKSKIESMIPDNMHVSYKNCDMKEKTDENSKERIYKLN